MTNRTIQRLLLRQIILAIVICAVSNGEPLPNPMPTPDSQPVFTERRCGNDRVCFYGPNGQLDHWAEMGPADDHHKNSHVIFGGYPDLINKQKAYAEFEKTSTLPLVIIAVDGRLTLDTLRIPLFLLMQEAVDHWKTFQKDCRDASHGNYFPVCDLPWWQVPVHLYSADGGMIEFDMPPLGKGEQRFVDSNPGPGDPQEISLSRDVSGHGWLDKLLLFPTPELKTRALLFLPLWQEFFDLDGEMRYSACIGETGGEPGLLDDVKCEPFRRTYTDDPHKWKKNQKHFIFDDWWNCLQTTMRERKTCFLELGSDETIDPRNMDAKDLSYIDGAEAVVRKGLSDIAVFETPVR